MLGIVEQRSAILGLLRKGINGERVLDVLSHEGKFIADETELWDFKESIGDDALSKAELVRDIAAFHNTYGGYLIVGIDDSGRVVGCQAIVERDLRNLLRSFLGADISVGVATAEFDNKSVAVVFVPSRQHAEVPLPISRIGPDISPRKPIFKPGDIFFRATDSSQLIRDSDDLRFLFGQRHHPDDEEKKVTRRYVPNNLPDRSVICERFFGRDFVKEGLWVWLADPMARYHLLVGPGGFGKTSIAYSFSESLCREAPLSFQQLVWLSAKREQFIPIENESRALPYDKDSRGAGQFYSCFETLLDALSWHFPIISEEWNDYGAAHKLKVLGVALEEFPSLVVVDDLDSLSLDDQRRAIELAMSLRSPHVRFLFTTRKNHLAPQSSTTEIGGLVGKEYDDYLDHLVSRFGRRLTKSERKTFHDETSGSPLFTESIFRLLKLGERFGEAIARWKGKDGEAVRAAAFRRELEQLSWASKRVLYAASMFDSVSTAEVRRMTELEVPEVEAAIAELGRLFLLQSKQIGDQSRFGVSENLRRAIRDSLPEVVPNHLEISRRAATLRSDVQSAKSRGSNKDVAAAIQQAMAQLANDQAAQAVDTLMRVIKEYPESADLWMVLGRCKGELPQPVVSEVRAAYQKSYDLGKREDVLFLKWAEFETRLGSGNSALDVIELGDRFVPQTSWEWLTMRALAHFRRGQERESRREFIDARTDLLAASGWIARSFRRVPATVRASLAAAGQRVHDVLWRVVCQPGEFPISDRYADAKLAFSNGDMRSVCVSRMLDAIEFALADAGFCSQQRNLESIAVWCEAVRGALKKRPIPRSEARLRALESVLASASAGVATG